MSKDVERTAVVLAGGFGTRIRHLLPDVPKPLAPVGGRPFVEWILRYLRRQGYQRVVISTGYLAEKIVLSTKHLAIPGLSITCVQEKDALGTAGGFLHSFESLQEKPSAVLVCNGDSLLLTEINPLMEAIGSGDAEAALLAVRVPDASRFGTVEVDENGLLCGFNEKRSGAGLINGGVYLFHQTCIKRFPTRRPLSFELDVFPTLLAERCRIAVIQCEAEFIDIGTENTLGAAEAFVRNNAAWFL